MALQFPLCLDHYRAGVSFTRLKYLLPLQRELQHTHSPELLMTDDGEELRNLINVFGIGPETRLSETLTLNSEVILPTTSKLPTGYSCKCQLKQDWNSFPGWMEQVLKYCFC